MSDIEKIPSKYEIDAMRAYIRRLEARNRVLEAALRASEVKIDELSPVPVKTVLRDV